MGHLYLLDVVDQLFHLEYLALVRLLAECISFYSDTLKRGRIVTDTSVGNIGRLMNEFLTLPCNSIVDSKPKQDMYCKHCDKNVEHVLLARRWRCMECCKGNYDVT